MFCPSCGSEERQATQFCRACGTDLRAVRVTLERPDSITAVAVSAREEIGRAVAEKIREVEDSRDLKRVAEDVLPQIEKFLESYEEKRLRRIRAGVIVAASGLGTGLLGLVLALALNGPDAESALMLVGLGAVAFAIGLGLVLNGTKFTLPGKGLADHSPEARSQNLLDAASVSPQLRPGSEVPPSFRAQTTSNLSPARGSSVTEGTTHHLNSKR
jgi:hypothetical protein